MTKAETPFTKAFDWHAAYSPSPWEGEGVEGSVPCPSCPSVGRTPAPGEGTTHREALGAQTHPACPRAHPGRRPPQQPQEGPTPLSLFASLMRLLPIKAPAPLRSASEVGARVQAGLLTGCLLATASSTRDRPRFTMAGAARGAGGLTYPGPAEGEAGREGAGRWAGSGRAGAEGRGLTGRGGAGQREGRLERGGAGSGRGRLRPERAAGPARRGWPCARS